MDTIINCFKHYTETEGYEIINNEDGTGVVILKSDIDGKYEYNKFFKSEGELRTLILQERVNGTDAMIDIILENIRVRLDVIEGDVRIIDFLDKIRLLSRELDSIVFELKYIEHEIKNEVILVD